MPKKKDFYSINHGKQPGQATCPRCNARNRKKRAQHGHNRAGARSFPRLLMRSHPSPFRSVYMGPKVFKKLLQYVKPVKKPLQKAKVYSTLFSAQKRP